MACKEIFDKLKEETNLQEEILNKKIKEGNENLKNILQKIKHEMEKISIYSSVNYEGVKTTNITEEEKNQNNLPESVQQTKEEITQVNLPLAQSLIITKEDETKKKTVHKLIITDNQKKRLKLNIKKKKIRLAFMNFSDKDKIKTIDEKKEIEKSSVVNEINYFISANNTKATTLSNNGINTSSSIQGSKPKSKFRGSKRPLKSNPEQNGDLKEEKNNLQTTSEFNDAPRAETNNNMQSLEFSSHIHFNPSSNVTHNNILSSSLPQSQKYIENNDNNHFNNNPENITTTKVGQNCNIIESGQANEYETPHLNYYPHQIDNNQSEINDNIHTTNQEEQNYMRLSTQSQNLQNISKSSNFSKKSKKISTLQKRYFELISQIDLLKQQNIYLKKTSKEVFAKPKKKQKKQKGNSKTQTNTINQKETKIKYQDYGTYKIDEDHVMNKVEIANVNSDFKSDFEERDYFGEFVDEIIKRSFRLINFRQCKTCADLLSKGKSTVQCSKHHIK